MPGVVAVYSGLVLLLIGLVTVLRPARILGLTSRSRGGLLLTVGALLILVGCLLPAPERRVSRVNSQLDAFSPVWQFDERHVTRIAARPERVFAAIHAVTANEIRLFRLLTSIRRGGRSQGESILDAPDDVPIIDVALRSGFLLLADAAPRELVIGAVVVAPPGDFDRRALGSDWYARLTRPGFAKATMNFLVEPDGRGGSLLSTETRVFATDAVARRRFAVYWRVIYPGSALIRRMWLRAIRLRAEAIVPPSPRPSVSTLGVPRDSVEAVLRPSSSRRPSRC
jgi:hypothetical protein